MMTGLGLCSFSLVSKLRQCPRAIEMQAALQNGLWNTVQHLLSRTCAQLDVATSAVRSIVACCPRLLKQKLIQPNSKHRRERNSVKDLFLSLDRQPKVRTRASGASSVPQNFRSTRSGAPVAGLLNCNSMKTRQ